ncbi:hypothetical protein AVEN_28238-1 [Araneus ventricosus]|uniref:Uncharacterized protein n=1 Tax=Araneus ventricosus TaxID=182803 RepID=A0A4Y2LDD2_ARAVE|nr:hypothetical protein AVEN_100290-1 [Araneus ventricosus]GBN12170.1 hypothetical protein AVEN_13636-1 [Araneus ventricosus]GBN12172.1 hypothetical protein AVEN_14920-1 [Araneus ventricosus]GBN12183.1 hypothetical protein AVEN_28238-1 [Araneus ventricosus]
MPLVLTVYTPHFSNCLFPNPVLNGPHLRLIIHYSYTLCKWRGDIGRHHQFDHPNSFTNNHLLRLNASHRNVEVKINKTHKGSCNRSRKGKSQRAMSARVFLT